jgi:hypothetical protein
LRDVGDHVGLQCLVRSTAHSLASLGLSLSRGAARRGQNVSPHERDARVQGAVVGRNQRVAIVRGFGKDADRNILAGEETPANLSKWGQMG